MKGKNQGKNKIGGHQLSYQGVLVCKFCERCEDKDGDRKEAGPKDIHIDVLRTPKDMR